MIVGVPRESYPGERRVALVPGVSPSLAKAGLEVVIEAGAGAEAGYPDAEYTAKGAKSLPQRADVFRAADIIVQVLCYGSNDKTGKAAQAVQLYQQLADKPNLFVPKAVVLLALADHYSATDPAQAAKLYNQVKSEFPDSAAAQEAEERLQLLPVKS